MSTNPEKTPEPVVAAKRPRNDWPVRALLVLALLFAVQQTRPVLLPIVVAIVMTFMLAPAVRKLRHLGITDSIGAAVVVIALLGGLGLVGLAVAGPAISWWERAPSNMRQLSDAVDRLRAS